MVDKVKDNSMASLFDGTKDKEDIGEIYKRLETNCPCPSSTSKTLWKLRPATRITDHNKSEEKILEKAVAMLSDKGHMPGWSNQCPVASGIVAPHSDKKTSVDLVHWDASNKRARLVELKWENRTNNDPRYALREVLRYGAAYVFCRIHRDDLPLRCRPLMDACHISLEVAAPTRYYHRNDFAYALKRMRNNLDAFRIDGLKMSLHVLAFPKDFDRMPFANGEETKQECNKTSLTPKGEIVRDAFEGLKPVGVNGR